jgi:hypothetical protein
VHRGHEEVDRMLKIAGIILIIFGLYTYTWGFFLGVLIGTLPIIIGISLIATSKGLGLMKKYMPKSVKVCPECKSPIAGDATVCMHCGYRYPEAAATPPA